MTHLVVEAESLAIAQSCARHVTILPDAILTRQIVLDAVADHPEETAQLTFDGGTTAKLHPKGVECWPTSLEVGPTLDLTLRVPFDTPLSIVDTGEAAYAIGGIGGPLTVTADGSLTLSARKTAALMLTLGGTVRTTIAQVNGPVNLDLRGAGDFTIADGAVPEMTLIAAGTGAVHMAGGTVERLTVNSAGSSHLTFDGRVGGGSATILGAGTLTIAHLDGTLERTLLGSGKIFILGR